jgi:hypothetical protein
MINKGVKMKTEVYFVYDNEGRSNGKVLGYAELAQLSAERAVQRLGDINEERTSFITKSSAGWNYEDIKEILETDGYTIEKYQIDVLVIRPQAEVKENLNEIVIAAECHSDDRAVEVDFDAEDWFKTAKDNEIIALAACGFGGDYPADYVAESLADVNEEIADMYSYIEMRSRNETIGFECNVNETDALTWISINRSNLIPLIKEANEDLIITIDNLNLN